MIKEIVDIGRVSNKLGSVFTFKDLPEYYVEVILKWNGRDFILNNEPKIKHLSKDSEYSKLGQELYLKYGVHRERTGDNKLYILLLSSFILDIESNPNKIDNLKNEIELLKEQISKNPTKTKEKELKSKLNVLKKEEKKFNEDKTKLINYIERGNKSYIEKYLEKFRKRNQKKCEEFVKEKINNVYFETKKDKNAYLKDLKNKCKNKYNKNKKRKIQYFIEKYQNIIINNIDSIFKKAETAKMKNNENNKNRKEITSVPIIIKIKDNRSNRTYFLYKKYFIFNFLKETFFEISSNSLKNINEKIKCNIYKQEIARYYPKNFYYPFSTDKVNVKYNLEDDKNLFLLSKKAYIDYFIGKNFLESLNNFNFMHLNCFITAIALNDETLQKFQNYVKDAEKNLDGLLQLINKNISNRYEILLNFYFWEYGQNSKDVVEFVKDIIPSYLIQAIKLFERIKDKYKKEFNRDLNFSWQQHIYHIFYKDNHKRYRTALFRKVALGDRIDLEWLMRVINDNMQFGANKNEKDEIFKKIPKELAFYFFDKKGNEKRKYLAIKHYIFLNWLHKINKGEIDMSSEEKEQKLFAGQSYEEKLSYFLEHANLVKESNSMKLGVCVGLMLQILSWEIPNYGKKSLAFVGKRIERNNLNSVQVFVNDIFAKTRLHGYESLQSINVRLATLALVELDDSSFNKDEFIFGLFLGYELYQNVKGEKDPEPEEIGENDEQNTTGEENE